MYQKIILKILGLFDFFHQKKINNFLKQKGYKKFKIFFDVGAHKGETINKFLSIFNIESIYSFEASPDNFSKLEKKLGDFKKKFFKTNIVIENIALGDKENIVKLKQLSESSSSTISEINTNSVYFKRKIKYLFYLKENFFLREFEIKQVKLENYLIKNNLKNIDFLKIDTEGYEFQVILGLENFLNNVSLILFEHHYDSMLIKKYKFSDINNYLVNNNFKQIYKIKMPFRKTFEYIYLNKK
mgnify:FL=1